MKTSIIKICGLKTAKMVSVVGDAGADQIGLVFFDKSPRNISAELARDLEEKSGAMETVGLFVDPSDALLTETLAIAPLDFIQLHGNETPERVLEIKALTSKSIIKAVGISTAEDVEQSDDYNAGADYLILDAKPPKNAAHPGGLGQLFDWDLLKEISGQTAWMLSGGLTPKNVFKAIMAVEALPGFVGVDVSSGVEHAKGEKDAALIKSFVASAHAAMSDAQLRDA